MGLSASEGERESDKGRGHSISVVKKKEGYVAMRQNSFYS